jgi:hypothetical protein
MCWDIMLGDLKEDCTLYVGFTKRIIKLTSCLVTAKFVVVIFIHSKALGPQASRGE